jgi:hypothetical protein
MSRAGQGRAFDVVEHRPENGESTRMTEQEFERMPLDQRVRAILTGHLRFFRAGREIPISEALS